MSLNAERITFSDREGVLRRLCIDRKPGKDNQHDSAQDSWKNGGRTADMESYLSTQEVHLLLRLPIGFRFSIYGQQLLCGGVSSGFHVAHCAVVLTIVHEVEDHKIYYGKSVASNSLSLEVPVAREGRTILSEIKRLACFKTNIAAKAPASIVRNNCVLKNKISKQTCARNHVFSFHSTAVKVEICVYNSICICIYM